MIAPVRTVWAAVASVGLAVAGMALVVFLFGWVLDPVPDPADTYIPAPTCRPGAPVGNGVTR